LFHVICPTGVINAVATTTGASSYIVVSGTSRFITSSAPVDGNTTSLLSITGFSPSGALERISTTRRFAVPVLMWVWYLIRTSNDASFGNTSFSVGHSRNCSVSGIVVVDEDVVVLDVIVVVVDVDGDTDGETDGDWSSSRLLEEVLPLPEEPLLPLEPLPLPPPHSQHASLADRPSDCVPRSLPYSPQYDAI